MSAVHQGITGAEVGIAFTAIATFTVAARLYTRFVLVKNPGFEELSIIFAWVFSTIHTSLVCVQIWRGLGNDTWNLSFVDHERISLPYYVSVPMYSIALFLIKLSILLLYLRLFPHERFIKCCWATVAVMGAFLFWTVFGFMFMCTPVKYFWDRSIEGHCIDSGWVYFTNAPFNIATDFILFGLPLPILWKLHLPRSQRNGLILLFGIGLLGCMTSILRLRSIYILSKSNNIYHDDLNIAIWSVVEVNVGICCACVPTLRPLINVILKSIRGNSSRNPHRTRRTTLTIGSDIVNVPRGLQGTNSDAKFDQYAEIQMPEAGKVRVTTAVHQEVDTDEEKLCSASSQNAGALK